MLTPGPGVPVPPAKRVLSRLGAAPRQLSPSSDPAAATPPRLSVTGLSKRYGSVNALTDLSLTLAPQQFVGLLGPNGAGKTTLFNCVAGLYRPSKGRILFQGHDITHLPSYRIARLGI
ncbi:MAG TPA: ATP-binding cassette domain-containing protein, partial [Burkholderiaceae bacterium]|nr:ATP-binding cassette domain-containing protein [Burkholderiaceae bacterium]